MALVTISNLDLASIIDKLLGDLLKRSIRDDKLQLFRDTVY